MSQVSFVGLGAMGYGMATHLLKSHNVTAYDISKDNTTRFTNAGGSVASTLEECTSASNILILMVATAAQASSILSPDIISSIPQKAILVLCSTVPASYVKSLTQLLASHKRPDIQIVDAPVSGGAGRAANGTLSIMAAGEGGALEAVKPVLNDLTDGGKKLYIVQGGIGQGSNMKMCHQVLAAVNILATAEATAYAAALDLDLEWVRERIVSGGGWSWMYENRIPRTLSGDYSKDNIASAITIILKDAGIITSQGRKEGFITPMTSTAEQVYFGAVAQGWGANDDSYMLCMYLDDSKPWRKGSSKDEAKISRVEALHCAIHLAGTAEALAFGRKVGLDLDQLFELSNAAAGGSATFKGIGPEIISALKTEDPKTKLLNLKSGVEKGSPTLEKMWSDLGEAVDEMQALRLPAFLAQQAFGIFSVVKRVVPFGSSVSAVGGYWLD